MSLILSFSKLLNVFFLFLFLFLNFSVANSGQMAMLVFGESLALEVAPPTSSSLSLSDDGNVKIVRSDDVDEDGT